MAVKRYDGSAWQVVAGKGDQGTSSSIATWVKTASGGETSLSGNDDNSQPLSYTVGQELVFINGALQKRGADYTATTGNSITGLTALIANDVVTVWTVNAFSVTNAISNTLVDAKGDLVTATGADVPARLAVGSNDQVLTADSSTATGLKWAAPAGATQTFTAINSGGTALSGSTTVTISGLSGYNQLLMFYKNASTNTATNFLVRLNADSGANYNSSRMWFGWGASNTVTGNGGQQDGSNAFTGGQTADAAGIASGSYHIFGANSTGIKPIIGWGTGQATGGEFWSVNGYYAGTSVISSISLVSANTFDAGTIYVFGA